MTGTRKLDPPLRVTDLVQRKRQGAAVTCQTAFEILPVDFQHRTNPYRAHIFLCRYSGTIDGEDYTFRKCYARGCPNNLCPHVFQAVQIANRYLKRDYHKLKSGGIEVEERLFELAEMMLQFDQGPTVGTEVWTMPDLVAAAKSGRSVTIQPALSFMPAVEHFDRQERAQTFLTGKFSARVDRVECSCERCFACFPTDGSAGDRQRAVVTADARLEELYGELEEAGITCRRQYFRNL
ncbi:MAG: hypothetical protein GX443_14825 [Deltaproteobacteria bacterium]|nr:hypothetical protein [Deltaproteobacteria bacterium]